MSFSLTFKQWKLVVRILSVIIALGFAIAVEKIPIFLEEKYEKHNRVLYAIIAIGLTIIMENIINKSKFKIGLIDFIKQLKIIRIDYDVNPDAIQAIMKATTFQLAGVLEQEENLEKENIADSYKATGNLTCGICTKNHLTDFYSRCENCKVSSSFWKKMESE